MRQRGHELEIVSLASSTRTAQEAADTIGCDVAQIAKSIVFRDADRNKPVVVITSGDNRVSVPKVETVIGARLDRADGNYVRKTIGFAIGGVPPAGHNSDSTLLLDQDLRRFDEVWAAAGTPFAVFRIEPEALPELTGAGWHDIAENEGTPGGR